MNNINLHLSFNNILIRTLQNNNYVQPRRGQIYVGFQCHQKCGFCYYIDKCNTPMFKLSDIIRQIDYEYEYGIRDFEITGGEPSEYKNLRYICEYIKCKDSNAKIAIITNGGLYNCDVWDIIDEVLISYHLGKHDLTYNKQMFPCGCTYYKVKKTVDIAKTHNKLIRTNSVIGTFNANSFYHVINDIIDFQPSIINILPINLFDNATSIGKFIDYEKIRPILKRIIDKLNVLLPKSLKFIRYMPYCDMQGYEHHIVGHLQHIYDWFDWNVELNGINVIEYSKINKNLGYYGSLSVDTALKTRNIFYIKDNKCLSCKYFLICDGVEKTNNNFLLKNVKPMPGLIIKNFMYYIQHSTYDFYKIRYYI